MPNPLRSERDAFRALVVVVLALGAVVIVAIALGSVAGAVLLLVEVVVGLVLLVRAWRDWRSGAASAEDAPD